MISPKGSATVTSLSPLCLNKEDFIDGMKVKDALKEFSADFSAYSKSRGFPTETIPSKSEVACAARRVTKLAPY